MEFIKVYISSFWIWAGITIGGMFVLGTFISLIRELFKFLGILVRGYPENLKSDKEIKERNEEIGKELAEKILNKKEKENNDTYNLNSIAKVSAPKVEVK